MKMESTTYSMEERFGKPINKTNCSFQLSLRYVLSPLLIRITNGDIADVFTVFAQTPVLDPKTGETTDKISAFIVERALGGVTKYAFIYSPLYFLPLNK